MDTYMLHHIVSLVTAKPEFAVRDEGWEDRQRAQTTLESRLATIWQTFARTPTVEREAYVYCTAQPWEC